MANVTLSCKERVVGMLDERVAEFEEALEADRKMHEDGDETFEIDGCTYEGFYDYVANRALAYRDDPVYRGKRLELSYGGPQDYFVFRENGDVYYHFLDWGDAAMLKLHGHDLEIMREVYACLNV